MSQVFSLTHRYKRTLQAMAAGTFLIYMTLVLYQNVYGYGGGNSVQVRIPGQNFLNCYGS